MHELHLQAQLSEQARVWHPAKLLLPLLPNSTSSETDANDQYLAEI